MQITFDPPKEAANIAKHGVSLGQAALLEWGTALIWPDDRRAYGEARQCALGYIGARLFAVAFVDRANERRIISLRKANQREEKIYAET